MQRDHQPRQGAAARKRGIARRGAAGLLLLAGLMNGGQAMAETRCLSPDEVSMIEIQGLKSALMVLATGCHDEAAYNAFVERYRPELTQLDQRMRAYFARSQGRRGQGAQDTFVTNLANAQSTEAQHLGSDFCPRDRTLFHEVMSLPSASDLPAYAAGKNLVPASLDVCERPATPATSTRRGHSRGHGRGR